MDFGGIVSPAAATSRTCSTGVGRRKKAASYSLAFELRDGVLGARRVAEPLLGGDVVGAQADRVLAGRAPRARRRRGGGRPRSGRRGSRRAARRPRRQAQPPGLQVVGVHVAEADRRARRGRGRARPRPTSLELEARLGGVADRLLLLLARGPSAAGGSRRRSGRGPRARPAPSARSCAGPRRRPRARRRARSRSGGGRRRSAARRRRARRRSPRGRAGSATRQTRWTVPSSSVTSPQGSPPSAGSIVRPGVAGVEGEDGGEVVRVARVRRRRSSFGPGLGALVGPDALAVLGAAAPARGSRAGSSSARRARCSPGSAPRSRARRRRPGRPRAFHSSSSSAACS